MEIKVNSNQEIETLFFGVGGATHTQPLELSIWTKVRVTFGYYNYGTTSETIRQISVGNNFEEFTNSHTTATSISIPLDDNMQIGGPSSFIGDLARFEIYSPGAYSDSSKF